MNLFWYIILTLGIIAGIVNLGIAMARRKQPAVALVRVLAGCVSLVAVAGVLIGKSVRISHPFLHPQDVIIGAGVFIFAVLFLPSYFERSRGGATGTTMQQRAARPANATVRLRDANSDEWVN